MFRGPDPGWVVGRTSQLKDLFVETRPSYVKYLPKVSHARFWSLPVALVAALLLWLPVSSAAAVSHRVAAQVGLGVGLAMFLAGLMYLLAAKLHGLNDFHPPYAA